MDPKFRVLLFRDSPARPPDSAARPRTFRNINSPPPRRAGGPAVAAVERRLDSSYRFEAVLLARLRSELGFGPTVSDADISWHVWRLLQIADQWSDQVRLETLKHQILYSLARVVGVSATPTEPLPMMFMVESQLHDVKTCYMHGLEIVRCTRMAGSVTLCLHAGPATPGTPGVITAVCKLLLPRVLLSVRVVGEAAEWTVKWRGAEGQLEEHYFFEGVEFTAAVNAADAIDRPVPVSLCLRSTARTIRLNRGRNVLGRGDLGDEFVYTSMQHCAINVAHDGSVSIQALGQNRVGVRAEGSDNWRRLARDKEMAVRAGYQIALSPDKAPASIFTLVDLDDEHLTQQALERQLARFEAMRIAELGAGHRDTTPQSRTASATGTCRYLPLRNGHQ